MIYSCGKVVCNNYFEVFLIILNQAQVVNIYEKFNKV